LTYNVLAAMKSSLALPPKLGSAKPKRLRFALFNLPARTASHAGKTVLRIARKFGELIDLITARERLRLLLLPPTPT
jgi:hypothetical protein